MPDAPETVRDLSRVTLRSNIEDIVRRFRDIHPSSFVDKIMSAIPVGSYPPRTPSSATPEVSELVERLRTERNDSVVAGLCCIKREVLDKAATALETLEARVRVLETKAALLCVRVDEWEGEQVEGIDVIEAACAFRAALLKQLSGDENG